VSALRRMALAGAALLSLAGGCTAALAADKDEDKWETRIVADKPGPVTLDPTKAYILVQADNLVMPSFMRLPGPEEAAKYAAKRAEELAKEHAKWEKKFASWQASMKNMERMPASVRRPVRPVEPTETNFGYPQYEQVHSFMVGPQNRFAKANGSTYLQEVPPGEYIFYGLVGTCACLGTVSFEAPAGKVVAVDLDLPFVQALQDLPKEQRPATPFDLPAGTTTMRLSAAQVSDARFPEGSVIAPVFKPAGRRPNWPGMETDRVMPIEGVFRYERDKQVDLRPSAVPAATVAPAIDAAADAATSDVPVSR
jgi:hypothetical protein